MGANGFARFRLRGDMTFRRQEAGGAEASFVLKKGGRVQVEYERVWYDCDILEVSDDGSTITARYDDGGDEEPDIDAASRVRPIPPPMPLAEGQKVEVWHGGAWYACDILAVSEDGTTCSARYEDGGDEEHGVDVRRRVRPPRIPLSSLEVGSKHKGIVVAILGYGAFVDIAAECNGFVHIGRIAPEFVDKVGDYVSVGQEVDVWVSQVENGKLSLSMVKAKVGGGIGRGFLNKYTPDEWITGTVQSILPFGIIVALPSPDNSTVVTGLVHVSQIGDFGGFVGNTADEFEIGQEVQVRVRKVRDFQGKLFLSMKRDRGLVNVEPFAALPEGTWLKGKVVHFTDFGLFVAATTPDGSASAVGLVHKSEMGRGRTASPRDYFQRGDVVDVSIVAVDVLTGDMSFSMAVD